MRYAIFSDIHSNIEAFQAVVEAVEQKNADKRIFLGDVVGYGASPNECVNLVREWSDYVLGGNHDYAAVGKTDTSYFNQYAKAAIIWTTQNLSEENKLYLSSLPAIGNDNFITFAHSSPFEPESWHYIGNINDARKNFYHFEGQLCFIGHSHQPVIVEKKEDGTVRGIKERTILLNEGSRYIVNDGSVGQPRDGNPNASFCIYDTDKKEVEIHRVSYDIESQQAKMRIANLPDYLINRIAIGR